MSGESYGFELTLYWQAMQNWHLRASYAFLQMQLHLDSKRTDFISETDEGDVPQHQFVLHSSLDINEQLEFDSILRYVDSLPSQSIDSYTGLDIQLSNQPVQNLKLTVVGRTLLDEQHA